MREIAVEEREAIAQKVFGVIRDQLGVSDEEVALEKSLKDDLGADSLDAMELVMAFEEAFKIEIPDEEAEKIKTVGDAVAAVIEKIKEWPVPFEN